MGSYGTRGVGYNTELLRQQINRQLGLNREYNVALVGAGNLGQALGHYRGFAQRGFHVVAAFDTDPSKVGTRLGNADVHPLSELVEIVRKEHITMALIATPAMVAQDVLDRLVEAGITSVLNFAPYRAQRAGWRLPAQGRPRRGAANPRVLRAPALRAEG